MTTQKFPTPKWHPPGKYEYVAHVAGWDIYKLQDYMQDVQYHVVNDSGRCPFILSDYMLTDLDSRFDDSELPALYEARTFALAHRNLLS